MDWGYDTPLCTTGIPRHSGNDSSSSQTPHQHWMLFFAYATISIDFNSILPHWYLTDTATKDSIKNNFKKLCVRIRDHWLRYMIFDNFTLNLVSVDAEKLISAVAMNVQRPIVDDYPCALAEAVRLLIAEKGELSLETWRTYDPWLWSCSDSLGNYLRYLSLNTDINSTTALCQSCSERSVVIILLWKSVDRLHTWKSIVRNWINQRGNSETVSWDRYWSMTPSCKHIWTSDSWATKFTSC